LDPGIVFSGTGLQLRGLQSFQAFITPRAEVQDLNHVSFRLPRGDQLAWRRLVYETIPLSFGHRIFPVSAAFTFDGCFCTGLDSRASFIAAGGGKAARRER